MKKYFYLLLCLPFLLAACDPDTPSETPEVKNPVLTLTSEAEMVFEEEGEGQITYTLENAPEGALPSVTCEAHWINDIKVAQDITFTVTYPVPYLPEDDQTIIKVQYEAESFEVTIKRVANVPDAPLYELNYINGTYYAPGYWDASITAHNYYIMLSSVENIDAYSPNSTYLTLDLYAATGDEDFLVIPNGKYTFNDSNVAGTISCEYSKLVTTDDNAQITQIDPVEGYVEVSDDKIEGYFIDATENTYRFVFNGNPALPLPKKENIEINGSGYTCYIENYDDYYSVGADNYIITILEDASTGNGNYVLLDIIVAPEAVDCNGEFTVLVNNNDPYYKYIPGHISDGYLTGTWYAVLENGELTDIYTPFYSGSITIADNGNGTSTFTFDCVDDGGYSITGSVTASVADVSAQALSLNRPTIAAPAKGFSLR